MPCFRLFAALLAGALSLAASDDPLARNSLKGIKAIYVGVEPLSLEARKLGLTDEALKKTIEERLRARAIQVLEQQDPKVPIYLFLDVTLNQPQGAPFWVYTMTLSLKQMVSLRRDSAIQIPAPTWALSRNGVAGERVFAGALTKAASELTDRFTAAFKAVNPK